MARITNEIARDNWERHLPQPCVSGGPFSATAATSSSHRQRSPTASYSKLSHGVAANGGCPVFLLRGSS